MITRGKNFCNLIRSLFFGVNSNDVNVTLLILLSRVAIMTGNMFRAIKIALAFHKGNSSIVVFIYDIALFVRDSDFFHNHAGKITYLAASLKA